MDRLAELYARASTGGACTTATLREKLQAQGIESDDARLQHTWAAINAQGDRALDLEQFRQLVSPELLMVERVLNQQLVVPEWQDFRFDIQQIFEEVEGDHSGANADYIPILRDADPERWGVAVCSVDGQRLAFGDVDVYHSIQSVSKPITYACALDREGEAFTHQYVGVEPSGRPFNDLALLTDKRPFNPCVNAGAIMTAGLVTSGFPELDSRGVTQELMDLWGELCGNCSPMRFSEETMISERATAENNFAIAYLLKGRHGLPRDVDLEKMLDVYFSCCSIEMTARMLAAAAATLANGGVCPITGHTVLSTEIVKHTLTVMQLAGMYDYAGTFSREVGLPAKSGVGGAIMVVVPNVMGFATFSPRLDAIGNSVRGVNFCQRLVERFNVHMFDNLSGGNAGCKRDPRASRAQRKEADLTNLRWGIANGDLSALRVRELMQKCMVDISLADGELEATELTAMEGIYADLAGEAAEAGALEALAASREKAAAGLTGEDAHRDSATATAFDLLLAELREQSGLLDDQARSIILETAFRVACSDVEIEAQEEEKLRALARALGVSEGVLEMEIETFRRNQLA